MSPICFSLTETLVSVNPSNTDKLGIIIVISVFSDAGIDVSKELKLTY